MADGNANDNDTTTAPLIKEAPGVVEEKTGAKTTGSSCLVMQAWARKILLLFCIPLALNSIAIWIFNTIEYETQWFCTLCRADESPSIKQQFMYFTIWNLWFTAIITFLWARNDEKSMKIAQELFRLALPHGTVVFVTYIYYVATNPNSGFLDKELCYTLGRGALAKSFTNNRSLVDFYLVLSNMSDIWVHWLSGPLMILLLATGELEYDHLMPYNVVFVVILGVAIGIGQTYGAMIYCGGIWFQVVGVMLFHVFFHAVYVGVYRRFRCLCCAPEETADTKDGNGDEELCKMGQIGVATEDTGAAAGAGDS